MTSYKLKRCYLIIQLMNDLKYHKIKDIQAYINRSMDSNYCKSQIEKDLNWIKWNLDVDEYEAGKDGRRLYEPVDFFERLKNFLQ